jgi:hypothetical protein
VTTRSCPSQPDVSILPHGYIVCQAYNVPIFPAPFTAPARTIHSTFTRYAHARAHAPACLPACVCMRVYVCVRVCVGVGVYVRLCIGVGVCCLSATSE